MTDSSNLTSETVEILYKAFNAYMVQIRIQDSLEGLCVCNNCFGDRQGAIYLSGMQRTCLERSFQLTDITDTQREWLAKEYDRKARKK